MKITIKWSNNILRKINFMDNNRMNYKNNGKMMKKEKENPGQNNNTVTNSN